MQSARILAIRSDRGGRRIAIHGLSRDVSFAWAFGQRSAASNRQPIFQHPAFETRLRLIT
jgi:hypothetical protein